jgi:NADH-quinone oxidoreductase E subunit
VHTASTMAWIAEDRRHTQVSTGQPLLTPKLKQYLQEKYFSRYPTKRAVLIPALHAVQHEYNWIPPQAMQELAEFLEVAPAEVLDTASFYEEFWLKPKGKYLVQVCRSLACHLCGQKDITDKVKQKLGIDEFETTSDNRFTLVELECLGACGTAPVMLVNDVLYENVTKAQVDNVIDSLPDDPHHFKDPGVKWDEKH